MLLFFFLYSQLHASHPNDPLRLAQLRTKHLNDLHKQAMDHRYMHEYGDLTIIPRKMAAKEGSKVKASKVKELSSGDVAPSGVQNTRQDDKNRYVFFPITQEWVRFRIPYHFLYSLCVLN